MKPAPRLWQFIASRIDANRRAERAQQHQYTASIIDILSRHAVLKERHGYAEDLFWRRQIKAAWWLNGITLAAAFIAIGTVGVLVYTLIDARKATVEANRAWVAPRTAFLRRALVLNDHPAF